MLHNIKPHEYHCDFLPRPPVQKKDHLLLFEGEHILTKRKHDRLTLPIFCDLLYAKHWSKEARYLFSVDDTAYYDVPVSQLSQEYGKKEGERESMQYIPVSSLRTFEPAYLAFAAITGYHLHFWYTHNHFCGACGREFTHAKNERALLCPHCGYLKYPDISLAVIVGVSDGDKLLLTRYANRPYKRLALIAGFVEIGEALEDTVLREVMEEVGLNVKNIHYYDSQPWGFSNSLLAGFFAEVDGSTNITLDNRELAEAIWVKREEIPDDANLISLTSKMMAAFKLNKNR
ncbi:MAG: NAD(+) diphosphatase [Firmicutes bacterium]|nr:NAD(+) diphosphatase [Bacillota bacterium]